MTLTRVLSCLPLVLLGSCTDAPDWANYDKTDYPFDRVTPGSMIDNSAGLLSAFFGLDNAAPRLASFVICDGAAGKDGMPVIFSRQLDLQTLQAGDFRVVRKDGTEGEITCVTPAPAYDKGELRTILLIGEFGSADTPPATVEIVGNIVSHDGRVNFKGLSVAVTPLEAGPSLVHAELVPRSEWELEKKATRLRFGGGSGCPEKTVQIVRAVWSGGVTKPGGGRVDDTEREKYRVTIEDAEKNPQVITPFALGDLGDGDNNHKLCLDIEGKPLKIEFPAGYLTDPRDDPNPETTINISLKGV